MPKYRASVPGLDTLGGRLTALRQQMNLSQREVGQTIGVRSQSISQWEQNRWRPRRDRLAALAELFETTVEILTGLQPAPMRGPSVENHQPRNNVRQLVYVAEIHSDDLTGEVTDVRELPEIYQWRLPEHVIAHARRPEDIRILRLTQDSLAPSIVPGDFILIDGGAHIVIGTRGFYLLTIDNYLTILRRVEPISGKDNDHKELQYRLTAENKEVEPRTVKADDVRILGRVIGIIRVNI